MSKEILDSVKFLEQEKGLDPDMLFDTVEKMIVKACQKDYGVNDVKVNMNRETGEYKVYIRKQVVAEVEDEANEISVAEANRDGGRKKLDIGDTWQKEVKVKELHRTSVHDGTQVGSMRLREEESSALYNEYQNKVGEMVTGRILHINPDTRKILLDLGKTHASLPDVEQIPNEKYSMNQTLKVYIVDVRRNQKNELLIKVSRRHPGLIRTLFYAEVPELQNNVVKIKSISREPGKRSKVAVYSRDPQVDPQGALIGPHSSRVDAIVNELNGEKIDIVVWNEVPGKFIAAALAPASVVRVEADEADRTATVIVPDEELTNAIGARGQNARLAAKLTGYKVDIKSASQAQSDAPEEDEVELDLDFLGDDIMFEGENE